MVEIKDADSPEDIRDQEGAVTHGQKAPLSGFVPYNPVKHDNEQGTADNKRVDPATSQQLLRQHLADQETLGGKQAGGQAQVSAGQTKQRSKVFRFIFGTPRKRQPKSRRWLVGGGLAGTFGLLGILAFLLMLAIQLKIPNLASNILEYDFARMIRQTAATEDRIAQQAMTLQAAEADPKFRTVVKGWLTDPFAVAENSYQTRRLFMIDRILPQDIIKNLDNSGTLKIQDHTNIFGDRVLDKITLNGQPYDLKPATLGLSDLKPTNAGKLLGKISGFTKLKNNVSFVRDFSPALREAMGADGYGFIRSSAVANRLRKQYSISLVAWVVGELIGKNPQQIRDLEEIRIKQQVSGGQPAATGSVSEMNDAANEIVADTERVTAEAEQEVLDNVNGKSTPDGKAALNVIQHAEANGGLMDQTTKTLEGAVSEGALKKFVGFVNPVYNLALPACIIYEGSLDKSTDPINNANANLIRTFSFIASAADQQRAGLTGQGWQAQLGAIGALSNKLGDISGSNAYIRANGGSVNTAATAFSPESGTGFKNYTLIDAMPGIGGTGFGDDIKKFGDASCPVLSNVWFALGSGVVIQALAVLAAVPTGGGDIAAEEAVGATADAAVQTGFRAMISRLTTTLFTKVLTKEAGKEVLAKASGYIFKHALPDAISITAMTIIAKLIVLGYASQFYNGYEQNADFANNADAGGILMASELSRQAGGRPLTCAELKDTGAADKAFIARVNNQKSPADRYFALSNPDSLLSKTAMALYGQFGGILSKPLLASFNIISGPMSFGSLLSNLTGVANALTPCADQNYGTVQFGFSESEENVIDSDSSYLAVQNQKTLDASGQEQAIAEKYAKCFGYEYSKNGNGSLDPTDESGNLQSSLTSGEPSMGSLLAEGNILRTDAGDLVSDQDYLCSPTNLGIRNPQYGDLVFRFRLALAYDTSLENMSNLQTITAQ